MGFPQSPFNPLEGFEDRPVLIVELGSLAIVPISLLLESLQLSGRLLDVRTDRQSVARGRLSPSGFILSVVDQVGGYRQQQQDAGDNQEHRASVSSIHSDVSLSVGFEGLFFESTPISIIRRIIMSMPFMEI